jgi:hypothetical protein
MLPHEVVRVTQRPQEVELYFPPLRNIGAAAGFGAFGALSVALPVAAAAGVHLTDTPGVHSWLAMILVAGFALPIMVFGFVFLALGAYLPANSLTVRAGADRIATTRRVFGWVIARRTLPCAEIAALEPQRPRQFQCQFSAEARYRLVARSGNPNGPAMVVAESLPGHAAMREVAELITRASGIGLKEK